MAEGLGAGGIEERKGFSPPSVSTMNAASPRVPLGSLVSDTPTAMPSRQTLTEDRGSAGAKRSAETVKRMNDLYSESGSCFWGQAWGEGAAHERITRVYTALLQ